jgi:hypothetical protein
MGPRFVRLFVLAAAFGVAACGSEAGGPGPVPSPVGASGSDGTLNRIRALGFADADIEDRGENYLVEGDILFPKEHRPGDAIGDLTQRWTNSFSSRETIRVLIDTASVNATYVAATVSAMQKWNALGGISLRFERVFAGPEDIHVVANNAFPGSCAVASYPTAFGSTGQSIQIQQSTRNCDPVPSMIHELGHTVGFKHTNNCAKEGDPPPCTPVPRVEADDPMSIMTNPIPAGVANFSDADKRATLSLYPAGMATASRLGDRTESFMVNRDGKLRRFVTYQNPFFNPNEWHDHGNGFAPSATFDTQITAVSYTPGMVLVFGVAADRTVKQFSWNGSQATWTTHPNQFPANQGFLGQITAVSSSPGTFGIFGLGQDNQVKLFNWNGSNWGSGTINQAFPGGLKFVGPLSALAWDGVPHIYGLGGVPNPTNGKATATTLLDMWWQTGVGWQFSDLSNQIPDLSANLFYGQITAFTYQGTPRVVGIGKDGKLKQLYWNGSGWAWDVFTLPSKKFVGPLSASSMGLNRIHIFGLSGGFGELADDIRKGGSLATRYFDDTGWHFTVIGNGWPL